MEPDELDSSYEGLLARAQDRHDFRESLANWIASTTPEGESPDARASREWLITNAFAEGFVTAWQRWDPEGRAL